MSIIDKYHDVFKWFETKYWHSWIGHAMFYFVAGLVVKYIGLNMQFLFGAGLAQEATQLDSYGIRFKEGQKGIPYYDYLWDLFSDIVGILVAYKLF